MDQLSQLISIPVIPVALLPVTGLLCLVFYNRSGGIHGRIRAHQKEWRDLYLMEKEKKNPRIEEMTRLIHEDLLHLQKRSRLIGFTLKCLIASVLLFSLCSFFLMMSLFYPTLFCIGLALWFFGPLLICVGLVSGLIELFYSLSHVAMQTNAMKEKTF